MLLSTPVEPSTPIPATLMAKLKELRPVLRERGHVQIHDGTRQRRSYRIRYQLFNADAGYAVYKSLELGDDLGLARAVSELIALWRPRLRRSSSRTFLSKSRPSARNNTDSANDGVLSAPPSPPMGSADVCGAGIAPVRHAAEEVRSRSTLWSTGSSSYNGGVLVARAGIGW